MRHHVAVLGYDGDMCIMLEKKAHMKARGLASPDNGDALALTFAEPIEPRVLPEYLKPGNWGVERPFDRYAEGRGGEARGRGGEFDRYGDG